MSSASTDSTSTRPGQAPASDASPGPAAAFPSVPGYLDAATVGLPPLAVLAAMRAALDDWGAGRARPADYDQAVTASRLAYARLVEIEPERVAVGSQVSVLIATVAASLPAGSRVVTVLGDFSSVVFPFLVHADRGVQVRQVPLDGLAEAVGEGADVVAFSLVQSGDGRIADAPAVRAAAEGVGALTVCDLTQAAGWLPVRAGDFDVTACSAYKWLCSPRGTAFLTVTPELVARLRPANAGWYAGRSIWDSVYGPAMELAGDARRFDVSPAWLSWVGTAVALELFAGTDGAARHRRAVALADQVRSALGLPTGASAIVALPDRDGSRLAALVAAGCRVAGRAGNVRLGFHVWNDENDVDRAVSALS